MVGDKVTLDVCEVVDHYGDTIVRAAYDGGADNTAVHLCSTVSDGSPCNVVFNPVTARPSRAATGSNLVGRVCVINAPTGAPIFGHHAGHVGWAYLVNRNTGEWEFGANEGPLDLPLDDHSKTWFATGTEQQMEAAFAGAWPGTGSDPKFDHGPGYYKYIRCESLGVNHAKAAFGTVVKQQGELYVPATSDCLSDVVNVIRIYSGHTAGLPSDVAHPFPNSYFKNELPNFEPILRLR